MKIYTTAKAKKPRDKKLKRYWDCVMPPDYVDDMTASKKPKMVEPIRR
jgi:hypothetical protein